jgi:hypothetical protein
MTVRRRRQLQAVQQAPGRTPTGLKLLDYSDAKQPPCSDCEAYCCRYLALPEFRVETFDELDWAVYLLNFDGIRLSVTDSGRWMPYWRESCRHLDQHRNLCKVHGTELQPHTCVRYNPFSCHYRVLFGKGADEDQLWVDRERMALVLSGVQVDERRRKVLVPNFEVMRRTFETMQLEEPAEDAEPAPEPQVDSRKQIPLRFDDPAVASPCTGCEAYCCKVLVVSLDVPRNATLVDYVRYALGFPGVELLVSDDDWRLGLPTTCRHLDNGRCGIYGLPERPVRCEYYDEWTCSYRDTFAPDRKGDVRLGYEDLPVLLESCRFDDRGTLLAAPSPAQLEALLGDAQR